MSDALREAVRQALPGVRSDLEALIQIPSVSADPGAAAEVRRCAEVTAGLFRGAGAPQVEILDGIEGGQPAVLARCPAPPGKPTVLLYAHHDVQPTGDPGAWTSPPFAAIERDGRLYGRGSADDKAGVAAHLAVLRAYHGRPPVGVTVFVEGEEEIGSPTLGALLERDRGKLAADVIVLADSANFEPGTPALTTTLRGLVDCVVEVRVLEHGVHSGVYGGAAPDALTALCRVLASLHDEQGNVAIDGLVTAKTPDLDYPEERFRAEAGLLDGVQLLGTGSLAGRIWAKPAASVLAIDATRVADASNTLAASARAKVSVRLAPGDDAPRAMRALARHLREHAPWGVRVDVAEKDAGQPYAVDARGPAFDAARAAFREAYGRDVVDMGVGGSIPFVAEFARTFPGAPILVTSAGADPDCRAHGPDESLHLGDFERACLAETLLRARMGGQGQEQAAEHGHADHLGELDRGGQQPAGVGGLGAGHAHQRLGDQRAEGRAEGGAVDDQDQQQPGAAAAAAAQVQGQAEVGERPHRQADRRQDVVDPAGQAPPPVARRAERRRAGREGQARAQGAVTQAELQVQREAEQEPAVADHRGGQRHQPGRQAGQVQPAPAGDVVGGDQARHQQRGRQAHRHVDQEHRPPGGAEQVGADQHAADHLADHGAAGQGGRVDAERAGAGGAGELPLDDAEDLGDHQRGAGALHEARAHQRAGVGCQPAGQRRDREGGQPREEDVAVPSQVAEPRAGDEQHRVGDGVARDHQLDRRAGGVQLRVDGRVGHVDDGDVEQRHELTGDQHGEHQPAAAVGTVTGGGYGGFGGRSGRASPRGGCRGRHAAQSATPPNPLPGASLSWYWHYLAPPSGVSHTGGMTMIDARPSAQQVPANGNGNGLLHHGRRTELAEFLRTRRGRITPTDVGLPPGLRRRTPGLRREEVAQLAGVGVTWYTWLEQGRPIRASVQVLDAVARTLRLDQAEIEHLYRLAEVPAAPAEAAPAVCPGVVREILDSLEPLPAMLLNARYDILGANQAHEDLFWVWHRDLGCEHRNVLWCCFAHPEARRYFLNFEQEGPLLVATLRASFGQHLREPAWIEFIRKLRSRSPEFAEMWARQEVATPGSRTKHFLHPDAGLLRLRSTSLAVADMPEARIVVYTPVDQETRERLPLTRRAARATGS